MAFKTGTHNEKPLTVAELVEFKMRLKAYSQAPEHKGSLGVIVATRGAIDLDHLARIISSPQIHVGTYWVEVKSKRAKKPVRRKSPARG